MGNGASSSTGPAMVGRFSREVGAIGAAARGALGDEADWESAEDMVGRCGGMRWGGLGRVNPREASGMLSRGQA
jgi:hypothetical protein